jgi:hypothetical protein
MSHLSEYEDGSDETILSYIDHCRTEDPYQSGPHEISLRIESYYDLIAVLDLVKEGLFNTRHAFIAAAESARSTDALFFAYRFKHLLNLQSQARQAAERLQGPGWLEKKEAESAQFLAQRERERADLLQALATLRSRS